MNFNWLAKAASATASLAILFQLPSFPSLADETSTPQSDTVTVALSTPGVINKIPLYTKKTSALQQYVDISRGFKLQRYFLTSKHMIVLIIRFYDLLANIRDLSGTMNSMVLEEDI